MCGLEVDSLETIPLDRFSARRFPLVHSRPLARRTLRSGRELSELGVAPSFGQPVAHTPRSLLMPLFAATEFRTVFHHLPPDTLVANRSKSIGVFVQSVAMVPNCISTPDSLADRFDLVSIRHQLQ